MTYNFDPERWYESHRAALEGRRDRGEIGEREFTAELRDLERRYEEMLDRLDGTFTIPTRPTKP